MKKYFFVYFLLILALISCKNQQDEISEFNSFYKKTYEFNTRILNNYRGEYYLTKEARPSDIVVELNELDLKFESLILDIDKALSNKQNNLERITSEYESILNVIPKIVYNKKDYLSSEFNQAKLGSNELNLNYIKYRLSIAMIYVFDFERSRRMNYMSDKLINPIINSYSSKIKNNGIKVSLTSNSELHRVKTKKIIIDKIEFNGKEKKLNTS